MYVPLRNKNASSKGKEGTKIYILKGFVPVTAL